MKALLVRVGIDQVFGRWNAPSDPSGVFVYVPIPERRPEDLRDAPGCRHLYSKIASDVQSFYEKAGIMLKGKLSFPKKLIGQYMHLDPDFSQLTYGDNGQRAEQLKQLTPGDLIVFYAGLRSTDPLAKHLVYALIGLYVLEDWVYAESVDRKEWARNAHTRRVHTPDDIIIHAKPRVSGLLERCIPIGEWRNRAYRVRRDILEAWGGLSVKDGYIQRSARLPRFLDPERFLRWFNKQGVRLVRRNN